MLGSLTLLVTASAAAFLPEYALPLFGWATTIGMAWLGIAGYREARS